MNNHYNPELEPSHRIIVERQSQIGDSADLIESLYHRAKAQQNSDRTGDFTSIADFNDLDDRINRGEVL